MTPAAIPVARRVILDMDARELRAIAARALTLETAPRSSSTSPTRSHLGGRLSVTKVDKPWGHELHWAITERYVGKVLHVKAGHALSLQYHNVKDETIFLWTGKLLFEIQQGEELVKRRCFRAKAFTSRRTRSTG